jgi:hypothetical protein
LDLGYDPFSFQLPMQSPQIVAPGLFHLDVAKIHACAPAGMSLFEHAFDAIAVEIGEGSFSFPGPFLDLGDMPGSGGLS